MLLALLSRGQAQETCVNKITLKGNKTAKEKVVMNEVLIRQGQCLEQEELEKRISESRNNLLNTELFTTVKITEEKKANNNVDIIIELKESINWLALPRVEFGSASIVDWWHNDRSLKNLRLGAAVKVYNLSGKRDEVQFAYYQGSTKMLSIGYRSPYYGKWRYLASYKNIQNRNIQIDQIDHKRIEIAAEEGFFQSSKQMSVQLEYRHTLRINHRLTIEQTEVGIAEKAEKYSERLLGGTNKVQQLGISYEFELDKRDNKFFPTQGYAIRMQARRRGLKDYKPTTSTIVWPRISMYLPMGRKLILEQKAGFQVDLSKGEQPLYFQRRFGLDKENYLLGYENEDFLSNNFWLANTTLYLLLKEGQVDWKKKLPLRTYREMDIKTYLSLSMDVAQVNNKLLEKDNELYGKTLYGCGIGLNALMYEQYLLTFQYGVNHQGKQGVSINFRKGI